MTPAIPEVWSLQHTGRPAEEEETVKAPGELFFPPGNEDGECVGGEQEGAADAVAAVVTVTFDRADYLKRHLDSLMAVHGKSPENRYGCLPEHAAL